MEILKDLRDLRARLLDGSEGRVEVTDEELEKGIALVKATKEDRATIAEMPKTDEIDALLAAP